MPPTVWHEAGAGESDEGGALGHAPFEFHAQAATVFEPGDEPFDLPAKGLWVEPGAIFIGVVTSKSGFA